MEGIPLAWSASPSFPPLTYIVLILPVLSRCDDLYIRFFRTEHLHTAVSSEMLCWKCSVGRVEGEMYCSSSSRLQVATGTALPFEYHSASYIIFS